MPNRRPSVSDALAEGRGAFSEPDTRGGDPAPQRRTPGRKRKGPGWEETNKLRSFYAPADVWDAIQAEVNKGDRSKTQVIVDAVRQHLGLPDPDEE